MIRKNKLLLIFTCIITCICGFGCKESCINGVYFRKVHEDNVLMNLDKIQKIGPGKYRTQFVINNIITGEIIIINEPEESPMNNYIENNTLENYDSEIIRKKFDF